MLMEAAPFQFLGMLAPIHGVHTTAEIHFHNYGARQGQKSLNDNSITPSHTMADNPLAFLFLAFSTSYT